MPEDKHVAEYLSHRLKHLHSNHYEMFRLQLLKELLNRIVRNNDVVLDLGINVGETIKVYRKKSIYILGLDIGKFPLKCTKANLGFTTFKIDFIAANVTNIPTKENSFDAVIMLEVIEHLNEDLHDVVLKEISRVAKENARMVISTPNMSSIVATEAKVIFRRKNWNAWDKTHKQLYTFEKFIARLQRKFTVLEVYGYYFLPHIIVSRLPYRARLILSKISYFATIKLKCFPKLSSKGFCIIALVLNRKPNRSSDM